MSEGAWKGGERVGEQERERGMEGEGRREGEKRGVRTDGETEREMMSMSRWRERRIEERARKR